MNHPHICTLHDIGNQDGIDFLVMEHLDGETLAQRLDQGALPLDLALRIAIQIADALDKAHRQGIVHRDLKPGNIMLTKAGAKLLDFGLAKLKPVGGEVGVTGLPTQSAGLTGEGTILGTLQYMAPEQLEVKDTDARSDIFAFGAVVSEMVTGQKAFKGDGQASLIGAILKDEPPPVSTPQPMAPAALDNVIKTCLAKDPDDRWQSVGDVGRQVLGILEAGSSPLAVSVPVAAAPGPVGWRRALLWVAGMVIGGSVVGVAVWNLKPSDPRAVSRFIITQEQGAHEALGGGPSGYDLAFSPDGRHLVYAGRNGGLAELFLRRVDSFEATTIPGTQGSYAPFFAERPVARFSGWHGAQEGSTSGRAAVDRHRGGIERRWRDMGPH